MPNFFTNKFNSNFTIKNRTTRMCIGDAIITLMEEKEYNKIKISDITREAGVSRMTFYKYYYTKESVLEDYLHELVSDYIRECKGSFSRDFPTYEQMLKALIYFDRYAKFFLKMVNAGLYSILIDAVNTYMEKIIIPAYPVTPYQVYYYAGAILNLFIKWEQDGKTEPAEDIARTISQMKLA